MKIGFYVQGAADEALIVGLRNRWCPDAELFRGPFRGKSRVSHKRDFRITLTKLRDSMQCEILLILTDSDQFPTRDVKRQDWGRVPEEFRHMCVHGVADRNIECWLAADPEALARELDCEASAIPGDNPDGFVKKRFGIEERGQGQAQAKDRIAGFVKTAPLKTWIQNSPSFAAFYDEVRRLSQQSGCDIPNER